MMQTMELGTDKLIKTSPGIEVKIFIHKDAAQAEKAIQTWLGQNKVLIHHIGQSQSEKGGAFLFILSIFYSLLEA